MMQLQSESKTLGSFREPFVLKYIQEFLEKTKYFKKYYL